jgi:hypothetical protein
MYNMSAVKPPSKAGIRQEVVPGSARRFNLPLLLPLTQRWRGFSSLRSHPTRMWIPPKSWDLAGFRRKESRLGSGGNPTANNNGEEEAEYSGEEEPSSAEEEQEEGFMRKRKRMV